MRALGGSLVTTTNKNILENNTGHQGTVALYGQYWYDVKHKVYQQQRVLHCTP